MSDKELHRGDKVEWKSHGTTVRGTVEGKITSDTEAAGRVVRASDDEPQYKVRSDKTGADAVHKPGALRPAD
ncbi:DUF2945 domain-containing protein [Mycobacterium parascrofulaceum]|nr:MULTISPECIES: DUF2945 domain-containing protein [Mycobacterium]OCB37907.1 hypothetical protein A9X02_19170 [Mycobacterium malmoense]